MRRTTLATALCLLPLVAAAPASADSIVFIKDKNVWVANPDGTAVRAITTAGDYWSPSQADDGTIAVAHGGGVELWNRDGTRLAELDPPALVDSVSHGVDGPVADVAISPDGKTIAFAYAQYSCPAGADCTGRQTMGYMPTSGTKPASDYGDGIYVGNPSWVSNTRTLAFGGFNHQVNTHDLGPGTADVHWFDDWEIVGMDNATDLDDGEVNAQGTKIALVRSYGDDTHLAWYSTNGPAPAKPTMLCVTGKLAGIHGPTFAPDGDRMAWGEPDGVWTIASTTTDESKCTDVQPKLTIPGGSEPDWGPAAVGEPKPPVKSTPPTPTTPTEPVRPAGDDASVQELVTVELAKKLRFKGFTATVAVYAPGKLSATAKVGKKVVARGSATARAAGEVKLKLKATKAGRKMRRAARAKLTVTFTPAGGKPQDVIRTIKLVR
jgi:hypothetical protein